MIADPCSVLITAGPTQEPIDEVRYLGNHSSGRMGQALAAAFQAAGAAVTLVCGPVAWNGPAGLRRLDVRTAAEMAATVEEVLAEGPIEIALAAAAVADYQPAETAPGKLHKTELGTSWSLEMVCTPDVAALMGKHTARPQTLVGFALEDTTDEADMIARARQKLRRKNADMILANTPASLEADTIAMTLVTAEDARAYTPMSKQKAAEMLAAWLVGGERLELPTPSV